MTDIFGLNESTDFLLSALSRRPASVSIIDPYKGVRHSFKHEKEAYETFVENCGHENYFNLVKQHISVVCPEGLIGFSAGASVLWRLAAEEGVSCQKMLGFYPSRIRHYLDLKPRNDIQIIFPIKEASFDVVAACKRIEEYQDVSAEIAPYDHGFMNTASPAYDMEGEGYGLAGIEKYLDSLSK